MSEAKIPEVLWEPASARVSDTRSDTHIEGFRRWLGAEQSVQVADYSELYQFSIAEPTHFWSLVTDYLGVLWHEMPSEVLAGGATGSESIRSESKMPGAQWFPGGTLNYAEHALRSGVAGAAKADDELAVIFHQEGGLTEHLTYGQLRARVAAARAALASLGVVKGDRVVALVPNCPQALVAFLATASLGALWSSCSPDFGLRAVEDRFRQLEPKVLLAVDQYSYGGKTFDISSTVDSVRASIPSLETLISIAYLSEGKRAGFHDWDTLLETHAGAELAFDPVPFDHPLWILFSSGTTGLPKGIVQGHGGIVVEHLKTLALQCDLGPGERFFWYTTTGWMMWNFLISGLLVGCTVVLYDGSPAYPDLTALWKLAEQQRISYFGTSAPFIQSCLKAELQPAQEHDLSAIRAVGSTGAPLSEDGFRWIAEAVSPTAQICSVSGGTDLCTAFLCSAPNVPVWLGELSCRALGAAVEAYDEQGNPVIEQVGELVLTAPMPSMPLFLWGDDGTRLQEAYFQPYPGVWRHGDWIRLTERGSAVIYGRSDATLNRGGVRMGTAEFYRIVEELDQVLDSLVIDTFEVGNSTGELLCFLVLTKGTELAAVEPDLRRELRVALSPRHVPDRFFAVAEIPRTLNGKKCEVPVKKILSGLAAEKAVSRESLANPDALTLFIRLAAERPSD